MIKGKVTSIMTKALIRFAEINETTADKVSIFIQLINKKDIVYTLALSGKFVKNEDGTIKQLKFVKDILGKKIDLLPTELLTANFLREWFENTSVIEKLELKNTFLRIGSMDNKVSEFKLGIYSIKDGCFSMYKDLKLEDVFNK